VRVAALTALALAGTLVAIGCGVARADSGHERKIVRSDTAMGTNVQVTFWTDDEEGAARGAQAVFDEMNRLDALLTVWGDDSEVAQINAAAGKRAVAVSDETFLIISRALDISKRSKGVFDITVGGFVGLWNFDAQNIDGVVPDPAEVKKRLKVIGWRGVLLDKKKHTVKLKKKGMKITLGGIAKGYAVDRGVAILKDLGFANFIVQAGGDMYVAGTKGGKRWMVGIRDPRGGEGETFAVAPIQDHSFSTSGDYERTFVDANGVRYHHIIDPRTGQPARATRSVTVMAKDAFTADSWSKVLFIQGADKALPLVEKMDDFDAVWVTAKNDVVVSSGLKDLLKILQPPTDAP
jgi:thiamine biosynthesis lipoprotein